MLLAWLVLHWGLLPRLNQWKPEIEARASQAIGATVRIGELQVRSGGWMPAVRVQDVVLLDAAQREALRLPTVDVALSARSLLALAAGQVRLEQLHIDGPDLEVRRSAAGQWFVAGMALGQAPGSTDGGKNELADWLFAQQEVAVRHGRVRWVDERHGSQPLVLTEVDLVLRNGLRHHTLRLDATPPADTGDRFTVQGDFEQPLWASAGDWQRWRGTLHLNLPRATLTPTQAASPASPLALYRVLPWQGASVTEGQAALRAWVDVAQGQVQAATTDLAVRQLTVQFPGTAAPLAVQDLRGRLVAQRQGADEPARWRLAARQLGFATADGVAWPPSDWALELQQAGDSASGFVGGALDAQRIDLAVLAQLAARLPLGDAVRKQLAQAAPTGVVSDLKLTWLGPVDAPTHYSAKGQAQGLSLAAASVADMAALPAGQHLGRPGFRNASASFNLNEGGGQATLGIAQGSLTFPGVFEQAEVAFDKLSTQVQWKITPATGKAPAPPGLSVTLTNTAFANTDVEGVFKVAEWKTGAGQAGVRAGRGAHFPGVLALEGQFTRGRAAAIARYLPLGMHETVRGYVQRAVLDGRVKDARFKVRGDLWEFPFSPSASAAAAASGEFLVTAQVEDVNLAYVPPAAGQTEPPWPAFGKVSGELVFDRNSMTLRNVQGKLWGLSLSNVNGQIAELARPVLRIEGNTQGPLADLLRYVNATPVGTWFGDGLRDARGSGNADLKLALELPFGVLERSKVQGNLALAGNDLRITPNSPQLVQAKGKVSFNEQGFSVREASARILGGDAKFEGGTVAAGTVGDVKMRFTGEGAVTAEGLRQAREFGPVTRWATALSGQTNYKLRLGFGKGHNEVALTSNLAGMGINLPAPFKKSPESALSLKVSTELQPGAARDVLDVELGNWVQARYQRDLSGDEPRVLRGALGVMAPMPPMPAANDVHAVLSLGSVKTEDWEAFGAPAVNNDAAADGVGAGAAANYLPHTVALRAQSLSTGGRMLTDVVLGVSQDPADGSWRGNIHADQLGGYVEYRAARSATQPGRIHARLARLALPPADASSVENLLAESPANAPALDIAIDNFELRGKKLGRLEIEANNRNREWRLNRFALITPEAQLVGTGQWQPRQRMVMDFKLDLSDSGAFLDRMGFAGTLRGGKGKLAGQLSWAGSPLAFHVPSLDGKINIALDAGQFLKAGPGAARLFSVLSLQSLPRRLFLDFRDVFQEGFAFDNVAGDVTITDGVAATNNLRLRGVQAAVLMEGRADLQRETQDLRVVVVPDINAGTASLAYAVINPAVGLGTFFAQLLLRRPLMAANTREFSVQGSWAEPKVERVERKPGDPVPDIDTPRPPPPPPPLTTPAS